MGLYPGVIWGDLYPGGLISGGLLTAAPISGGLITGIFTMQCIIGSVTEAPFRHNSLALVSTCPCGVSFFY